MDSINNLNDRINNFNHRKILIHLIYFLTNSLSPIAHSFGPAYLKIVGPSTNHLTFDDEEMPVQQHQLRIKPSDWRTLNHWMRFVFSNIKPQFKQYFWCFSLRSVNFHPVVALPYMANNWQPRDVIKILGISDQMGVTNCIWQLGAGIYKTDFLTMQFNLTFNMNRVQYNRCNQLC